MKSKLGISKQLFIALTIVNLSVTLFSVVLGYVIYNYAIEKGWISLSEPYRVCRRVNILRDYPDDKTKLYPRN
nr:hypothetical protein [Acinetobacter baumannii]